MLGTAGTKPNGDDWFYDDSNTEDYSRINGTEGNRPDPLRGWVPDTEDANNNNSLDPANNYFEYEIDLSDLVHDDGREIAGWKGAFELLPSLPDVIRFG